MAHTDAYIDKTIDILQERKRIAEKRKGGKTDAKAFERAIECIYQLRNEQSISRYCDRLRSMSDESMGF